MNHDSPFTEFWLQIVTETEFAESAGFAEKLMIMLSVLKYCIDLHSRQHTVQLIRTVKQTANNINNQYCSCTWQ